MDSVALVDVDIDEGMNLLQRLQEEGLPIDAACWVKPSDEDRWSLFIATPLVERKGITGGYLAVNEVIRGMQLDDVFDSRIKLFGSGTRTAQALRDIQAGRPGERKNVLLGNTFAECVYVYPPPGQKPFTIYGMRFQGAPLAGLYLSFEPQSEHEQLTITNAAGGSQTYPAKTGIDWLVTAPGGAKLEQDHLGRTVLGWDLHGKRTQSDAHVVYSLAKLGLHGFRILQSPNEQEPPLRAPN